MNKINAEMLAVSIRPYKMLDFTRHLGSTGGFITMDVDFSGDK
ncbi:hypothetical protein [Photobacterium halotolerans]|nr:hypothetical protein [Photobacterium halotolerans]